MFGFKLVRRRSDLDRQFRVEKMVGKIAESLPFRHAGSKKVIAGVIMCSDEALAITKSEFNSLRGFLMAIREDEKRIKGE